MTAFRSQTDEMLAAKFDPQPYISARTRKRRIARYRDSDIFDPRPEFIPSKYTLPEGYWVDDRPEPNPILVAFRREATDVKPWLADRWMRITASGQVPWAVGSVWATPEQIDHARKVLTRLAALS